MKCDITSKITNYFNIGNNKEKFPKNKTLQSVDNIEELKKNFPQENNQNLNNYINKSINYINPNMNNFSSNSEENIKSIIEENSNLFLEINQLEKDIDVYSVRLDELNNEYNKLKQDYRDNLIKNISFEKSLEEDYYKLEEEKYKLKLNHLLNINKILKDQNEKALKHNEKMKILYKTFSQKNLNN